MSGLMGLLSRIRDAGSVMRDNLMPAPQGLMSMISPDELRNARSRGLISMGAGILNGQGNSLQAIGQGIQAGQQGYDSAIGSTLQQHDYAQAQADAQQQREQHDAILRARAAIANQFQVPPNATESQRAAILQQMMIAYSQAGDTEMASKIGEVVKSLGRDPVNKEHPTWQDFGGYKALVSPDGTFLKTQKKTPTPRDPNAGSGNPDHYADSQTNTILDDFHRDTVDYDKARSGYEVLKGAFAHPGIAQPFAVLDAYARVINPGAVVRQGTMQVLQEMGSYDDKVRRWLQMAKKGRWPEGMLEDIKGTVDAIMAEHTNSYQEKRKYALERARRAHVDLNDLIPDRAGESLPLPSAAPAAPAASPLKTLNLPGAAADDSRVRSKKHLPGNPFAKQ